MKRLDDRARSENGEDCGVPERDPAQDGRFNHLREGWYLGSQAFTERTRNLAEGTLKNVKSRKTKLDRNQRQPADSPAPARAAHSA